MQDLILGLCVGYRFSQIEPFVASMRQHLPHAELCLFVADVGDDMRRMAASLRIRLEEAAPHLRPEFHPVDIRYRMYADYLRRNPGRFRKVLLADLRDVLFQGDPFSIPLRAPVETAVEKLRIGEERYNREWIRSLYGEDVLAELADKPISCCGTTLGTVLGISEYIDVMCREVELRGRGRALFDQGCHNYVVWKARPELVVVDVQERLFSTVGLIANNPSRLQLRDGTVFADGMAAPVVHQYDRDDAISRFVSELAAFRVIMPSRSNSEESGGKTDDAAEGKPDPNVLAVQGQFLAEQGEWSKAAELWQEMARAVPSDRRGYIEAARALRKLGRYEQADEVLCSAAGPFPQDFQIDLEYAWVAHSAEHWEDASRRWRELRLRHPANVAGYICSALSLRVGGRREEAEALLREASVAFPENPEVALQYAWSAHLARDWKEADARWAAMRERFPHRPEGFSFGGGALRDAGQYEDAIALLAEAAFRFPDDSEVAVQRALIPAACAEWTSAVRLWGYVRTRFPERVEGYSFGGRALWNAGAEQEAQELLAAGLRQFPRSVEMALAYAELTRDPDMRREGLSRLHELARLHPYDRRVREVIGRLESATPGSNEKPCCSNPDKSNKQHDLDSFFGFLQAPETTPEHLVRFFVGFHGDLDWGRQDVFVQRLRDSLGAAGVGLKRSDVLGSHGEVQASILRSLAPDLADAYFTPQQYELEAEQLLPESPNQWLDFSLPDPLNLRLKAPIRPSFTLLKTDCRTLFASRYGYMAYDRSRRVYWPDLASRAFDRSVDGYPRVSLDRPLVVAMDQFDGANFSHFLFDTLSRVLHFQSRYPGEAARSCFLLGGEPGPLHRLALTLMREQTGLQEGQFMFLDRRVVFETTEPTYFFSDQARSILHPLQMCHPASVRLVRDLFSRLPLSGTHPDKVYISRGDATLRRITNEEALFEALRRQGYTSIRLSDHDMMQQLSIVARARSVVAPHGMGLTWLLFHRGTARVTELFHPGMGTDAYAFVCRAIGLDYGFLVGLEAEDGRAGYTVPVEEVVELQAGW